MFLSWAKVQLIFEVCNIFTHIVRYKRQNLIDIYYCKNYF